VIIFTSSTRLRFLGTAKHELMSLLSLLASVQQRGTTAAAQSSPA
jgi:hypothetical protein